MRQAGRYLPEYNATRAQAGSFLALATIPELATEVTLQPLARFPLDAAILFSDILTVPDAMGLGLSFAEGEGPRFARAAARRGARSRALAVPDMAKLRYVFDAVALIKRALAGRVPLIGFAGSPFTLACYMIEGGGSADFRHVRRMAYARPDLLHRLVDVNAQRRDRVPQRADRRRRRRRHALRHLGRPADRATRIERFSLAPMRAVLRGLARERDGAPCRRIVFTKGGGALARRHRRVRRVRASASTGRSTSRGARARGRAVALQGNLDPLALLDRSRHRRARGARRSCARRARRRATSSTSATASCPRTPPENVAALVEAVHAESRRLRHA